MNLKGIIERDRDDVFLKLEDFAEEHVVDGKKITISIDSDTTSAKAQAVGVDAAIIKIFAKSEDLPEQRSPGQTLNLDGKEYVIFDWTLNYGITEITLGQTITM